MNFTANGLVIKETVVGEADKSLIILAEGHGKISAWAKNAKRMKNPLMNSTTLFTFASFSFFQNKDRVTINEATVIESFFGLRADLEKLALASYLVSLASDSTPRNQEEDELLRLTLNALFAMSLQNPNLKKIKAAYELRSMVAIGYLPELSECVCCGKAVSNFFFSAHNGGLLCEACNSKDRVRETAYLSQTALDSLRYIASCDQKKLYSFQLGDLPLRELGEICEKYVLSILGHKPKALEFYEKL